MNLKEGTAAFQHFEAQHSPAPGRTLVVGSKVYATREDRRQRYPDAIGIDMEAGPGVDLVMNLECPSIYDMRALGKFAHIDCISVLEHTPKPWLLAQTLEALLEPGGTLLVAVPFCWRIHSYPSDYWRFTPDGLRALFPAITWDALKLANETLSDGPRIAAVEVGGHPYMSRTETVGFGRR